MNRKGIIAIVGLFTLFSSGVFVPQYISVVSAMSVQDLTNVTLSPMNPRPQEPFTATLENYSFDTSRATISWYLNGKVVGSGVGLKKMQFTAGRAGLIMNIGIILQTIEGPIVEKNLAISPQNIDLTWQAFTATPPFYKGKALFSSGAAIKLIVLPSFRDTNGRIAKSDNLIFTWQNQRGIFTQNNGLGKDTFMYRSPFQFQTDLIAVKIENLENTVGSETYIQLLQHQPIALIYEESPTYGMLYNRALSTFFLTKPEIKLVATPFFFAPGTSREDDLKLEWSLNGKLVKKNTTSITFRRNSEDTGKAEVLFKARVGGNLLQSAAANLTINLENDPNAKSLGVNPFPVQ